MAAVAASGILSIPGLSSPAVAGAGASPELRLRLSQLRRLRQAVLLREQTLLPSIAASVPELIADDAGPVRKLVVEMIGDIGLKSTELLPEMAHSLLGLIDDEVPAVARQAITTGTQLFRKILEDLVAEYSFSNEVSDSLRTSWECMLKLKAAVLLKACQTTLNEGVRLLVVKFVEAMVLLYTPDPGMPLEPPNDAGGNMGFNIAWLRGGHPVLNISDLAMEASQSLELLLEQLKFPQVKSISTSMRIIFVNSLSAIAQKRPSFYGRVLPVLLSLDPESAVTKDVQIPCAFHALKNAFEACLKCTHSSAEPWRSRISEALTAINDGEFVDQKPNSEYLSTNLETLPLEEETYDPSCKRTIVEEMDPLSEDDHPAKRSKLLPLVEDQGTTKAGDGGNVTIDPPPNHARMSMTKNFEAVQQLVSMFGALAAQGDRAAASLEVLSSSISIDLLAEVVLVNMQNLPIVSSQEDGDELKPAIDFIRCPPVDNTSQESSQAPDHISAQSYISVLVSLLKETPQTKHNAALELNLAPVNDNPDVSGTATHISSFPAVSNNASADNVAGVAPLVNRDTDVAVQASGMSDLHNFSPHTSAASVNDIVASDDPIASFAVPPIVKENISSASPSLLEAAESKIPVNVANLVSENLESSEASHTSTEPQESRENVASSSSTLIVETSSAGHSSLNPSDTQSTAFSLMESTHAFSSSLVINSTPILPRLLVPDISLEDWMKDSLQINAFTRILEADKQIDAAGGSTIRIPLLAHLGVQFHVDLDIWEPLRKHILSDYSSNEGHHLALCVLNRLYRDTEQDHDYLQSRSATELYDQFLQMLAKALRDTFPASDKSLSRLLCEVPYLPDNVLKLLEELCCPEGDDKLDKDLQNGDRVTQGLSAVWNLIMLRPSGRGRFVEIALQSASHPVEEVRMKAIRLVANKLFPMESITNKIEEFAKEKICSLLNTMLTVQSSAMEGEPADQTSLQTKAASSVTEAQRCMSLYFALCTKKHSLLRHIFSIFASLPETAKQAVGLQMPILVRTIASSPDLLGIISDPPPDCQDLVMQVLRTLTEGVSPSHGLILSVKTLYSRTKDVDTLFPILPYLSKDEILHVFPNIVELPLDKFQLAVLRIVQGSPNSDQCLSPSEILIFLHGIDPEKEGIALKKVMDACSACFEQRTVFTQQVLAKALNQLVEQIPLPLLFMRTVIQAIGVFPGLVDFVMDIMSRLVNKQIWKYPKLWVGFLKCAIQTKPQSYGVLLQLPAPQLENALNKNPALKSPLADHANQPNIRSTLPRSTLVVLGLVEDQPPPLLPPAPIPAPAPAPAPADTTTPAPTSQGQVVEPSNSVSEVSKEASEPADSKE